LPQRIRTSPGILVLVVHNNGRLTHSLTVSQGAVADASTGPIPPGAAADLIAELDSGSYTLGSSELADQALGLYGTLVVGN
jgi:hypothetical protein